MAYDDSWSELCRISVARQSGTAMDFHAFTEDIKGLDFPKKPMDFIPMVSGGQVAVRKPMSSGKVSFKVYPLSAAMVSSTTAIGGFQWMHPQGTDDNIDPVGVSTITTRNRHQIVMLWAQTLPASAGTLPAQTSAGYRHVIRNAYLTEYNESYDDKVLTADMVFEYAPLDKDGVSNHRVDSQDGSNTQMSAVVSF